MLTEEAIIIHHQYLYVAFWGLMGTLTIGIFVADYWWTRIKRFSPSNVLLFQVVLLFLILATVIRQGSRQFSSLWWGKDTQIEAPDNNIYGLLRFSLLQGRSGYLVQLDRTNWLNSRWKILGETNYDWPERWAILVRPRDLQTEKIFYYRGALYYFETNNHCKIYYDPQSMPESIEELDPFIMIGPTDELNPVDVADLDKYVTQAKGRGQGTIPAVALRKGLSHPNARVRELAESLLEKHVDIDRSTL